MAKMFGEMTFCQLLHTLHRADVAFNLRLRVSGIDHTFIFTLMEGFLKLRDNMWQDREKGETFVSVVSQEMYRER